MLGLFALIALFYAIGSDDSAMNALTALERAMFSGSLPEQEKLRRLLRLEAIQILFAGSALWWFLLTCRASVWHTASFPCSAVWSQACSPAPSA